MGFLSELVAELRLDLAAHPLDRDALRRAADDALPSPSSRASQIATSGWPSATRSEPTASP